ncbi:MAG: hypothetical protein M3388_19475 [Acidobacteriota bacterium]|nr:hypothetical protein [Acidobacteriota bacterium]
MKANLLQQNTKRVVAGLLVVWLSGVVFLFCCETSKAKASETESCPLSKTSHCNKKSSQETVSQLALLQTVNQTIDCCLFPSQVFDKARKVETNQQSAEVSSIVKVPTTKFFFVKREFSSPKLYRSLVYNRGSTGLKNCVFRI